MTVTHNPYRSGGDSERSFTVLITKSDTNDGDFAQSTVQPPWSLHFDSSFGEGRPFMDLIIEAQSKLEAITSSAAIEIYGRTTAMALMSEPIPSADYRGGLLGTILLTRDEWGGHLIGKRQTHVLRGLLAPHACSMQFYLRPVGCSIYKNAKIRVVLYSGGSE